MRPHFSFLLHHVDKYRAMQTQKMQAKDNQIIGFIVCDKTFYLSRKAIKNSGLLTCVSDVIENEHIIDFGYNFIDVESFHYVCSLLNHLAGYEITLPNLQTIDNMNVVLKKLQIKL